MPGKPDLKPRQYYPWGKWMKTEKVHTFRRGVHFHITPRLFSIACYTHARRHGLQAITKVSGSTVVYARFVKKAQKKSA